MHLAAEDFPVIEVGCQFAQRIVGVRELLGRKGDGLIDEFGNRLQVGLERLGVERGIQIIEIPGFHVDTSLSGSIVPHGPSKWYGQRRKNCHSTCFDIMLHHQKANNKAMIP
jgi:hypothetical protein